MLILFQFLKAIKKTNNTIPFLRDSLSIDVNTQLRTAKYFAEHSRNIDVLYML